MAPPVVIVPVSIPVFMVFPAFGAMLFVLVTIALPVRFMAITVTVSAMICLVAITVPVAATICLVAITVAVSAMVCLVTITMTVSATICLVTITMTVSAMVCLMAITMPVSAPVCLAAIAAMIAVADANIKTAVVRIVTVMISGVGCPVPIGAVQLFPAQIAVAIAIGSAELVAHCMAQFSAGDHAVAVQIVKMKRARVDGTQIGRSATMASAAGAKGDPEVFIAEDHADVWAVVMAAAAMLHTAQRLSGKLAVIVAIKSVKNTHELLDHLPLGDPSMTGEGGGRSDYGE